MRSGGIRRNFDYPPPRQLRIVPSDFLSSGALIGFPFCFYSAQVPLHFLRLLEKLEYFPNEIFKHLHHTEYAPTRQLSNRLYHLLL